MMSQVFSSFVLKQTNPPEIRQNSEGLIVKHNVPYLGGNKVGCTLYASHSALDEKKPQRYTEAFFDLNNSQPLLLNQYVCAVGANPVKSLL